VQLTFVTSIACAVIYRKEETKTIDIIQNLKFIVAKQHNQNSTTEKRFITDILPSTKTFNASRCKRH